MKKVGLFIVCIVVIIIGAFSLSRLSSAPQMENKETSQLPFAETTIPTPNPSWQTYNNPTYGFSIKYPESWRLVDNNLGNGTVQFFNYSEDKYIGGEPFSEEDMKIEMAVLQNTENMTLMEFVEEQTAQGLGASQKHITSEDRLGTTPAVSDMIESDSAYKSYFVELSDGNVLVVTLSPNSPNPEAAGILSSFIKN